jgi:hypothetical protein
MRLRKRLPANSRGENKLAYGVMAVSVMQSLVVFDRSGRQALAFTARQISMFSLL